MGRFTLRDEGKTIAVGKVLKYKPVKVSLYNPANPAEKNDASDQNQANQIQGSEEHKKQDLVYDLDTGETVSKEEYDRRRKEREEKEL